ncbi:MAG: ATPase [Chloroflexi bacterium]|jgi:uncharacterized protein YndB with AHSA1/START domain|nr:ATPase [Chloroflexota bacterium]
MAEDKVTTQVTPDMEKQELLVERTFDAPRELVWKAWTEPERLAVWWGPKDWKTTTYEMDVKPGGVWRYCMRGPDGMESCGKTVYREIVEPERLVYIDLFTDAEGNVMEGMPTLQITTEFTEYNGKTRITSITKFASTADLEAIIAMGAIYGITENWERLADYLAAPELASSES